MSFEEICMSIFYSFIFILYISFYKLVKHEKMLEFKEKRRSTLRSTAVGKCSIQIIQSISFYYLALCLKELAHNFEGGSLNSPAS